MATVNTVLGTIDSSEMGFTLPHEHLIDSSAGIRISYGELELRDRSFDMAVRGLQTEPRTGGVDTIVEVSPDGPGPGRGTLMKAGLARQVAVNFVCSTGSLAGHTRAACGGGTRSSSPISGSVTPR